MKDLSGVRMSGNELHDSVPIKVQIFISKKKRFEEKGGTLANKIHLGILSGDGFGWRFFSGVSHRYAEDGA